MPPTNDEIATHGTTHKPRGSVAQQSGSIINSGSVADFLRRRDAAEYLRSRYGFGTPRSLAKLASVGGGPEFRKIGTHLVVYEPTKLDEWALSRLSAPKRHASEVA